MFVQTTLWVAQKYNKTAVPNRPFFDPNEGKIAKDKANKKTRQHFAKITAAILLNDQLKLALFWWIKWRIIYYRWKITGQDHVNIMAEAKKKSQEPQYLVAMAYSMTMADIWTMMTKKEAEVFLRELNSAKGQQP